MCPLPANAASKACAYFASNVQASFNNYVRVKNLQAKKSNLSIRFEDNTIEDGALQNLNNHIQIYRNLNCDVQIILKYMDKIGSVNQEGLKND